MKKSLVTALTTALVVGAASTTFAAANPFSDVSADHWAYDAVTQLAADGVIEGYGDGTYRGQRNITRYEMAQMIAKAMAKGDVGATDKALIDRLAAEFSDELNSLGVRVSNLEKHADMVKWTGKVEYTYTSTRGRYQNEAVKVNNDNVLYRLEPTAEVNDHWTIKARIDGNINMRDDQGANGDNTLRLKRAFAEGDYKNFNVKLGMQEHYTNEHGLLFDDEFSGLNLQIGNKVKVNLLAGRINPNRFNNDVTIYDYNDTANYQAITVQYDTDKGIYGGASYHHLNSEDFRTYLYSNNANTSDANIWALNLGYKLGKANLHADYAGNTKADWENKAWQVQFDYGNYDNASQKGQWSAYVAYRRLGYNTSLYGTYDGIGQGVKGWEVGANYAIMKNIGLRAIYADGNFSGDKSVKYRKLFGRVEFFF